MWPSIGFNVGKILIHKEAVDLQSSTKVLGTPGSDN